MVDHVQDGDSIHVKLVIGEDVGFDIQIDAKIYARVRVIGINAPELKTAEGKAARDFLAKLLLPGTPVEVTSYHWDKYGGRVDGDITLLTPVTISGPDGDRTYDNVANLMLDTGHAVAASY
jgi:endonuclease YncB( thermonuclease family)